MQAVIDNVAAVLLAAGMGTRMKSLDLFFYIEYLGLLLDNSDEHLQTLVRINNL